MILQTRTYVHLEPTQRNLDRLHVRFVTLGIIAKNQELHMYAHTRSVSHMMLELTSYWLRALNSPHQYRNQTETYETGNRTECTDCNPGHYCISGFQFECLEGTYQNKTKRHKCDKCKKQRSCDGKGLTNYMDCPPARFQNRITTPFTTPFTPLPSIL